MVYYWEPTLKGHGIPEAMEAVLFSHSRMRLRVAFLKPLATALAIGTGGPFGAEGPIIQTGAALGSLFGQAVGLTPYYRRVLLASGAAAGMAATFTAPLAGVLVAVELLLFELRARSFIPVALAAAVATGVRIHFAGWAPLFPMPAYKLTGMNELWLFGVMGMLMGIIGIAMIRALFWIEDFFDHLPFKRALIWSPAIGAGILGVIGYFYPQVFGTGYDTIRDMLNDRLTPANLLGVSVAKFWALVISLGSGTTGGVFAPSLIVGGGIGGAYAMGCQHFFPHLVSDPAFYALVAMAGVFGGIARAPFTSIVFLFELSHNPNSLLPLIVCVMVADGFVRLFSRDSIMTSKLVKRGLIVLQDYSVPVLMRARIDQVMRKQFSTIQADVELRTVLAEVRARKHGIAAGRRRGWNAFGHRRAPRPVKGRPARPPFHHARAGPAGLCAGLSGRTGRPCESGNASEKCRKRSGGRIPQKPETRRYRSRQRHSAIAPVVDGGRESRTDGREDADSDPPLHEGSPERNSCKESSGQVFPVPLRAYLPPRSWSFDR